MSINFGEGVKGVKVTILTNNTVDLTLQTDLMHKEKVIQPGKKVLRALAEHGLAMSIEADGKNILYDFGGIGFTVLKNLEALQMNPQIFQKAVLSHGHFDHFGTLMKLLPKLDAGTQVIVSPEIYKQKVAYLGKTGERINLDYLIENYRALKKAGKIQELPGIKKRLLENLTSKNQQILIETKKPMELLPGIWTSGEIELFDESELSRNLFLKIDKRTYEKETFRDEIAIYIKIKNKGLVVLTGCGHAGIINTIKHGQKISGVDEIYAVIGGFHLIWSSDEHLNSVLNYFTEIRPEIICGMHCTGFKFNTKLHTAMPDCAVLGVVGTDFIL